METRKTYEEPTAIVLQVKTETQLLEISGTSASMENEWEEEEW